MSNKVLRIFQSILNTPHLADEATVETILSYLNTRNSEELSITTKKMATKAVRDKISVENGIAIIDISGTLTYKFDYIDALCGIRSYESILAEVNEAIKQSAHTLVFDMDTGGGQAYACFETANQIRQIADENNIKIITYVDGMAASGGYALAAISDEIIVNPMSKVGSIGVVVALKNILPKLIKENVEVKFITAGESKVPYAEDGTFKEEALEQIQEDVSVLYTQFVEHVSSFRGITPEEVRGTEAKTFRSDVALDLKLVDKIMTHTEFMDYLADSSSNITSGGMPGVSTETISEQSTKLEEDMAENAELQAKLDALESQLAEAEAERAKLKEKAAELEQIRLKEEEAATEKLVSEMKDKIKAFSFVSDEDAPVLASFLATNSDEKTTTSLLNTLASAQEAIDAVLEEVGTTVEVPTESNTAVLDKLIAERFKK